MCCDGLALGGFPLTLVFYDMKKRLPLFFEVCLLSLGSFVRNIWGRTKLTSGYPVYSLQNNSISLLPIVVFGAEKLN
jgi:hypothetical protein